MGGNSKNAGGGASTSGCSSSFPSAAGPGTINITGNALDVMLEQLLSTNPSLQQSSDARAAAGLRVQDKSVLLDNPTSQMGGAGAARWVQNWEVYVQVRT